MRNRIFGAIGVIWGGLVVLSKLLATPGSGGSSAYASGQMAGTLFGVLMFLAGLYYLIRGDGKPKEGNDKK